MAIIDDITFHRLSLRKCLNIKRRRDGNREICKDKPEGRESAKVIDDIQKGYPAQDEGERDNHCEDRNDRRCRVGRSVAAMGFACRSVELPAMGEHEQHTRPGINTGQ